MTDTTVQWFRTRGGSPGPHRRALDLALSGRDLAGADLVTAEMARGAAELADSARRAQDPRLWLAAAQRLDGLVRRLGLAVDGDRGDDARGVESDGLAAILGAGATVGDSAES